MKITAPVPGWCGRIGDVVFTDGVADTGDHAVISYCADLGYTLGDHPADPVEPVAVIDEKAQLVAEAEALGIPVDARWGVKRLADEIAARQP